jgi:cation:H+ antiporter
MIPFALTAPITAIDGAVLLALFVVFIAYIAVKEFRGETPTFRNQEVYEELLEADSGRESTDAVRAKALATMTPFDEAPKLPGWPSLGSPFSRLPAS